MKRLLRAVLALALPASRLFAAAPVYTDSFVSVTLDGVRLGTDLDPSNLSLFPSVAYDSSSGVYHMWVTTGSVLSLESIRHATSTDGVHFVSTGNLSFAGGSPFPIYGAPAEPPMYFARVAKLGNDWKLLLWTHNEPAITGDYNYNESVNDIGADPSTLAVAHQGPVYPTNGTGTFGQTTGPFGMVNGALYVADDRPGGISKWTYGDTTPPDVAPPAQTYQDLITGTGYVYFLTHPGDPLAVYVHNVGRVVDQGDGTLGVYYSLRHPDGTRVNKQIYYAQSPDDGLTWSAPAGLFPNGDAVRVDGSFNTFAFSHPEVTLVGGRRVLYFSTKASDGQSVVATSASQPPSPGSWSGLFGSGQGAGESGRAVIRTSDSGYAIAGDSFGFVNGGNGAFWLLKFDATGEIQWQKTYFFPGGPFHVRALAETDEGGLVVAGSVGGACTAAWVLEVDVNGAVVWSKTYATNDAGIGGCADSANALILTSDGGLAFSGRVAGYFGLAKLTSDGTLSWIRAFPGGSTSADSAATSLVEVPGGGFALAGSWRSASAHDAYRVLRVDASGILQWQKTLGGTLQDSASSIANRDGGGFVVTGGSQSVGGIWTVALDDDGTVDWQKTYTQGGNENGGGIVASSGGFAIAGTHGATARAALLEIDGNGAPQWGRSFAALQSSHAGFHALTETAGGGFLAVGEDVVGSDSRLLAVRVDPGGGFVGCLDELQSVSFNAMATAATAVSLGDSPVDELANTTTTPVAPTSAGTDAPENVLCSATLPSSLAATALNVDVHASGGSDVNGVADPGERFLVEPAWTNDAVVAVQLSGRASIRSDSNGLDPSDPDADAHYGTIPSLSSADCHDATGDCYMFQFQSISRPSQHWDTTFDETLSTSDPHHRFAKRWTIHAGLSFDDASPTSGFYPYIENIFHNGITVGCGLTTYCPGASTTRAQMAVFLLKSRYGAAHVPPPPTGTAFVDVPVDQPFAAWIEELAGLGVTAGCGEGDYCPDDPVTRKQMAVLLIRTLLSSAYVPPTATGIFGDVPASDPFAPWIEDLYNRHITAGCDGQTLMFCPTQPNTREQMAVFLTRTFSLHLYGP